MMNKILLVFAAFFMCIGASYSQTTKTNEEIKAEFLKQREFALDVDLSNTVYSGMNYDEFAEYMEIKENMPQKFLKAALSKYKVSFYSNTKKYKFVNDKNKEIPFRIHIKVENISEKAGIQATAIITYNDSVDIASIDLPVEDGRWNSFDVLLEENAQKQLKELNSALIRKSLDNYYIQSKATFTYIIKP